MHICMIVFGDLNYDFRVFREADALQASGHRVTVVALQSGRGLAAAWEAIEVRQIPVPAGLSLRFSYPYFWWRAAAVLRAIRADAYHAHDLDALLPASRAAFRLGVPLVYDSHELWTGQSSLVTRPWVRGFWERLERRLIKHATRIISVSEPIARELERRHAVEPVVVVRNMPPFRDPVEGDVLRQQLGLESNRMVLLYQGGFLTDNGLAELIAAMDDVPGADLVLLGGGPTEGALKAQVRELGLAERVHFVARVPFPDLHRYTCSADLGLCLIKPTGRSFYWSMPNKLFEYMMAGLPVVGSDLPQIQAVIESAGVGQCVQVTTRAIAEKLRTLLATPELLEQYAAASRASAERYCWECEQHRLIDLYAGLLR